MPAMSPEAQILPHATGAAADTVSKHQDPQDLIFYGFWPCPYAQRAWITLEERGIPYQYKEVNPYKKEAHFLAINPKGLVPAVEYKGKALYESLILCEFFEDAYPSYQPNFLPTDPFQRAYVRIWVDYINKNVIPGFMRLIQAQNKAAQNSAREEFYKALRTVSEKRVGPYFLGEEFSLVDVAIAPWVVRDYIQEEHRGYKREDASAAWKEWAESLEKRPSIKQTSSLKEYYADIYARYLRDETQSEVAKAIREGRPIP